MVERKYWVPFKREKLNPFWHPYYWFLFILFGN